MFKVVKNGANRIDIEINGKLNSSDMKVAIEDLLRSSKDIEHGQMLYRINEFDIPTFGAMAMEFSYLPQLFKLVRRFDRVAVLADKSWVKKVSEIEGALIPGLEMKAFNLDEKAKAENWLTS